eukprot:CAMPEP_0171096706 /NCGR_PEP_ID=MMETSP0766_2-20121228/45668_1 /TAXON_ID=439317 /ORGANISM="Gambierdiscus australes, Strain CAWD 149" /LENGTH=42 /DNA_ID= /DNA_START= /DNA_END= /DNA_ORIENTATION=
MVFGAFAPMSVSEGCLETKTPPISPNSALTLFTSISMAPLPM